MGNSTLSEISKAQLSANTTLSANTGKANQLFDNFSSGLDEDIDSLVASAFDKLRSTGFDGVTGLETGKVEGMIQAVDSYIEGINGALSPLNGSDATKAFGDQMNKAIQDFVIEIKSACEALISNIKGFKDDLKAIKAAMEAKAQNVNTAVNNKKNELNSSKSSWTYSGASN